VKSIRLSLPAIVADPTTMDDAVAFTVVQVIREALGMLLEVAVDKDDGFVSVELFHSGQDNEPIYSGVGPSLADAVNELAVQLALLGVATVDLNPCECARCMAGFNLQGSPGAPPRQRH
jgi:hypothetical protein